MKMLKIGLQIGNFTTFLKTSFLRFTLHYVLYLI